MRVTNLVKKKRLITLWLLTVQNSATPPNAITLVVLQMEELAVNGDGGGGGGAEREASGA